MAAGGPDYMLEFAHGYTYSAHPVACAAGIAAMRPAGVDQGHRARARAGAALRAAVHGLKGAKHVADIRNFGLAAGFTVAPVPGRAGQAARTRWR
jgi:beta-alanine--pyruvate transaminase